MTFEEFFAKKKIDLEAFRKARPEELERLAREYNQLGRASFEQQYLFYLNEWRLAFPLVRWKQPLPQAYAPPEVPHLAQPQQAGPKQSGADQPAEADVST